MADSDLAPLDPPAATPVKTFTTAERIAELNEIDKSVAELLASAAEAVGILSNSTQNVTPVPKTLTAAQARFIKASSTYFSTLSAIDVRLRRQVYALEEAGLIQEGDDKDTRAGRALGATGTGRRGAGSLDPSWLNARADSSIELKMRKELVAHTRAFLDRMKAEEKLSPELGAGNQTAPMREEP